MDKRAKSVAKAAAVLAGDKSVETRVKKEIQRSTMITRLIQWRVLKEKTQKEIADFMGCDPSKISRLESGNDSELKWVDMVRYLAALEINMSILFDDVSIPAAARIKQHVFAIHRQLEGLAVLAKTVEDDDALVDKIHQFYGEVLFNFVEKFEDSYRKLEPIVMSQGEVVSEPNRQLVGRPQPTKNSENKKELVLAEA